MSNVQWIKIRTDIFDDEKIKVIDSLPERDAIFVIWIKLLTLAGKVNDSGQIYLSQNIPYTEEMLSTIFNRPLTTIKLALKTFESFGMIELNNDFIGIINWEKHQNVDALEKMRENTRNRVRKHRESKALEECNVTVTKSNASDKNRNRKDEISLSILSKEKHFDDNEINDLFIEHLKIRKKIKAVNSRRAVDMLKNKLRELSNNNKNIAIKILNNAILNSWKSLYPLKKDEIDR